MRRYLLQEGVYIEEMYIGGSKIAISSRCGFCDEPVALVREITATQLIAIYQYLVRQWNQWDL